MTAAFSAVSIALLALLLLVAVVRTRWAIVAVMAFPAIEQLIESFSTFFARRTWVINVAVGLVAIASLTRLFVMGDRPFRGYFNATTVLTGLLFVLAVFGVFYSMMPEAGRYFISSGFPYYVLFLVIFPGLVTRTSTFSDISLLMLFVGCAVMLAIAVSPRTLYYGARMYIDLSYSRGSSEERGNPLAIGELGGMVVIFAALMASNRAGWLMGLIRAGAFVLGIAICFVTSVRGQLIFALFFSVVFFPLANRVRDVRQFMLRAGVVGVTLIAVYAVFKIMLAGSESAARFSGESIMQGIESRSYYLTESMKAYFENPANLIQGLGTGSFNAVVNHGNEGFLYPHNVIVEVLTHHGLIGFGVLTLIFVLTGRSSWVLFQRARAGLVDGNSVAIVLALSAYFTMIAMKQGSFLLYPLPFYMFLVVVKMHKLSDMEMAEGVVTGDIDELDEDWDDDSYAEQGYGEGVTGAA